MQNIIRFLSTVLLAAGLSIAADAAETITVEYSWARETPPGAVSGAAYLTLINPGPATDRLLSASGDIADTIELHTHRMENGMMAMRPVEAIEVKPGVPTVLEPGGLHIMLIDLKQPLVSGQVFTLNLNFEKAGPLAVPFTVRKAD
jgi:hypothetical protein